MRIIRASEIGEYVFCHRAWWLHQILEGHASANAREMAAGTARHARHGRLVSATAALRVLALLLLLAAVLAFVLASACPIVACHTDLDGSA